MTPSRTATQRGQDPPTASARREAELLQNTPRRRASKQAVPCGIQRDVNGGAALPPPARTRCRENSGGSQGRAGRRRHAARGRRLSPI